MLQNNHILVDTVEGVNFDDWNEFADWHDFPSQNYNSLNSDN
jgi:hypothetical protein